MTKQDPRFAQKITNERARELYGECVEMLYEYETNVAPAGSGERPRYSMDVLELGQILNEFISQRTAIAMNEVEPLVVDPRIVAAIKERDARTDRCGDELVSLITHALEDEEYVGLWMPAHVEAARLFRAIPKWERGRVVRQVLDELDQVAIAQLRARTRGQKA